MASYYAQSTLASSTGDPADAVSNVWGLDVGGVLNDQAATVWSNAIQDFYDDLANGLALRGVARTGHLLKMYDVAAPRPNYPVFEIPFQLAIQPPAVDLPRELALCISYRAEVAAGVNRARGRGRIFVPGFSEAGNLSGRPAPELVGNLASAWGNYYFNVVNSNAPIFPGVYSRRDQIVRPIVEAWVDNEWDIQRRRGTKPTIRTEIALS
jgi:hypothetical protein